MCDPEGEQYRDQVSARGSEVLDDPLEKDRFDGCDHVELLRGSAGSGPGERPSSETRSRQRIGRHLAVNRSANDTQ